MNTSLNTILHKLLINKYLNCAVRLFLGGMFVIVAISKISNPEKFANEIGNYNLAPDIILNISALILPWVELVTGVLLITGNKVKESSTLILLMLITFTLAVLSAMMRGLDINCGCYSDIAQVKVGWGKIFENMGLIILSIYTLVSGYYYSKKISVS